MKKKKTTFDTDQFDLIFQEASPRSEEECLGGEIKVAFSNTLTLLRSKTKYKEDFVLAESRPKDMKDLLILQSSGSEESNYGSISSRSSDSSKENNVRPYKGTNNLKPVPQKQQDLKKNIRNFPKEVKKFSLRPNNKVVENISKKNLNTLKTRYDTPPVGQTDNSDTITVNSSVLSNSKNNVKYDAKQQGNSLSVESQPQEPEPKQVSDRSLKDKVSKQSANQSSQSVPKSASQGQQSFQGDKQKAVQNVKTSNSRVTDNGLQKTYVKNNTVSNAVVKTNSKPGSSTKPIQVVSNKLISNVREEVNRQKSAKQTEQDTRVERKNSGKNSSLTHSIKQMINVAKSVVVPTSESARQRNSVMSKSVDAGQSVAPTEGGKSTMSNPSEFLRSARSGKTVYTDISNNTVSAENTSYKATSNKTTVVNIGRKDLSASGSKSTNTRPESNQMKRSQPQPSVKSNSVGANSSKPKQNTAMTKSTPTNISSPVTSRKNSPAQLNTISNASSIKTPASPLIIKSASMSTIQDSTNDKSSSLKTLSSSSDIKSESDSNIKAKIDEQKPPEFRYKPASAGKPPLVEILPADTPRSKRIKGVSVNPLEPVATPIIVNPFEQFEQVSASEYGYVVEKPNIERSKTQTSIRSRGKSAGKSGKGTKPSSATSSRGGGVRKVVKTKNCKTSDDGINRPRSGKTKKRIKSGKRRKKSAADSVLSKQSEQSDVAVISGIGWHVATSCLDKFDATAVQRIGSDSSESSDSDDLDMPTPRHYRPLRIETYNIADHSVHSPRFLEVKQRELNKSMDIPVLDNDGYPHMNLDVTQNSLPSAFDIENFLKNLNQEGFEGNFDQLMKSLGSARHQEEDMEPDYISTPEIEDQTAVLHRQILLGKLTPIPESPSLKSSHALKTAEAIQNFEQNVKEETLNKLLGLQSSDSNNNKGVETAVRNSATDMVLGNTLNTSPKQVTSQPPSGKSSGRRQIERAASSEKRGSNPVSRVSSNTSVKDKLNSASRLNKGNDSATSKGRQSRQNSGDFKRSTEWIHEKEIRRSREPINEISVEHKNEIIVTNERQSSEECLLDEQGNVSSRRERKFSESKSDPPLDENIETAIQEILSNNSMRSTSTLKSNGSFRLSNRNDTITPADRQLLLKMTADADNSPFHAARLSESFTPTRNMNMTFDHDEKGRLAESFTPRANKLNKNSNDLVRKSVTRSHPHLDQSVDDLDAKQTMAKIVNSFRKMEIYVGDHKRETRRDVTKPEISASVPTSAVRPSVRAGTPTKVRSAGKFTEIKQVNMTPRGDDGRIVKSGTRVEDSRAIKSSSNTKVIFSKLQLLHLIP